jgi:autotransporter-associated beta strand protein
MTTARARSRRVSRLLPGSVATLALSLPLPVAHAADVVIANGQSAALGVLTTGDAILVGAGTSGTLDVAPGSVLTLNTTDASTAARLELGNGGSGILNLTGGTIRFNIAASSAPAPTAIGRLWVGGGIGNSTGGTGTFNMTSGLLDYVELDPNTLNFGGLAIGRGLGVAGTFNQSGGTVRFGSSGAIDVGTQGGTGSYVLGGSAVLDMGSGGGTIYVGSRTGGGGVTSTGSLRISDSASMTLTTGVNAGGQLYVGDARSTGAIVQDGAGSVVTLGLANPILFGGNVNNAGGSGGGGSGSYTLSAGTLNIPNVGGSQQISFGAAAGGRGDFLISGGTANIATNLSIGATAGSTGLLRQTGGTLSLTGSSRLYVGAGTGSYELLGGRLQLGGAAGLYGGGSLTFGNGTLAVQGSHLSVADAATLATGSLFTIDTQGLSAALSGVLSGAGGLTKLGAGTLTLSAANSYTGATTIGAGTLALSGAGSIASSSGLVNNGVFDVSATTAGASIASLSGSGRVETGLRSLVVGTDNGSSAFSGTIVNGGVNWDPSYGVFAKVGTGTLTIDGATVSGGEFHVRGGSVAQTGGATGVGYVAIGTGRTSGVSNVGALDVSGGTLTVGTTLQVGDFGGIGTVNQTGGSVVVDQLCGTSSHCAAVNIGNQGGTGVYNISDGSLNLLRASLALGRNTNTNPAGSGTLNLGGTGLVDLTDGRFNIGNWVSVGVSTPRSSGLVNQTGGTLRIRSGGILYLSGSGNGTYDLLGGALEIGGTSLRANYGSGSGSYAFNLGGGTIRTIGSALTAPVNATLLAGTQSTIDTNGLGASWSGVLSGSGGLIKAGDGTLTLSAVNSYTGLTTIDGGTLALSGAGSIAASSGLVNDGVFDISATTLGASVASLSGGGRVETGLRTLQVGAGNGSTAFSGTIVNGGVGWQANYGRFQKLGTGTLTLDGATISGGESHLMGGAIAQTGGQTAINYLAVGTGTTGGAANIGALNVSGGSLTFGTGLQVGDFGGAGTVNQTGGQVVVQPGCGDPARCALFNIGNQGGTGIYNISGGSLTLTSGSFGLGRNSSNNPASSGTLNLSGSGVVDLTAGFFTIGNWLAVNGTTQPGSGVVNQTGGTFRIGQATNLYLSGSGNGTYNLLGGALEIGGTSLAANYNNHGGSYQLNLGGGTVRAAGTALAASVNATLLAGTQSTIDSNGLGVTWSGTLSGDGALAKVGGGSLTLTGANSYGGGTTISAGTLQIGAGGTTGSLVGDVVNNATLAFNRSDAHSFAGVISGSGAVTKAGASTLTLTGANSYSGSTTIAAGTLALANGGRIAGAIVNDGIFDISATTGAEVVVGGLAGSGAVTLGTRTLGVNAAGGLFSGNVSGTGGLRLAGGTQILTGTAGHSGGTTITAGTLQLGDGGTSGSLLGDVVNHGTLAFNRADAVTFGEVISGSGALLKAGAGTLTLTGANSFAGATTIAAGTLALAGAGRVTGGVVANGIFDISATTGADVAVGGLSGAGSIALGTRSLAVTGAGGSFAGSIGGAGGVTLLGGSQVLTGTSSYAGGTTIAAGTLRLGAGGTSGSIAGNVRIDGELVVDRSDDVSLNGVLTGGGTLTKAGANRLTLTAANSFAGSTVIAAGTLAVTGAGRLAGNVVNDGALVFDTADDMSFGGAISGTGTLTQAGTGRLTLGGIASHGGGTTIAAGTLALSGSGRLTGALVANGVFDIAATTGAPVSLRSLAGNGAVTLGSRTLTLAAADGVFGGTIAGTGGLNLAGGTQILTGSATYTGGTAIAGGSTLQLGNGGTGGSIVGAVVNNGTLAFSRADSLAFDGGISGAGTLVKSGAGTLTLGATNSYGGGTLVRAGTLALATDSAAGTGRITLESGTTLSYAPGITVANPLTINGLASLTVASGVATQSGALSGSGRYLLGGAGRLLLTGDNSGFGGGVSVADLTLDLASSASLGSGAVDLTGSATFRYGDAVTIGNGVTIGGGFTLAAVVDSGRRATQAGVVSGGGTLAKTGGGTLVLSRANSFSGGTLLAAGTIEAADGAALGSGRLAMGDRSELSLANGVTLANHIELAGDAGFAVADGRRAAIGGAIVDGSQAGGLVKTGGGTLALTAANSFSGGTLIAGGAIEAARGDAFGSGLIEIDGSTLLLGDGVTLANEIDLGGIATIGVASGGAGIGASIEDGTRAGGLVKTGAGILTLTAANRYSGGTTIAQGTLRLGTGGRLLGNIANAGVLAFDQADRAVLAGSVSGTGAMVQSGAGTTVLTGDATHAGGTTISAGTLQVGAGGTSGSLAGDIVNDAALVVDRADAVTIGGRISGSGGLTHAGAGTLTLTGSNSYTGGTTIAAGTLRIGDGGTRGSILGPVTTTGTLIFDRANATSFADAISGGGALVKTGAGVLTLGGASSFTGGTTVQAGTLLLAHDRAAGAGRIILEGGATLGYADGITIANDLLINGEARLDVAQGTATQAGAITGTGRYRLTGAGRLLITGDNSSFTGPVTISGVSLDLASNGALGSGEVELAGDATLSYGDGLEIVNAVSLSDGATLAAVVDAGAAAIQSGAITGNGAVAKTGTGTMILTGDNDFTGGTTIAGGILQVGDGGTSGRITGSVMNNGTLAFNRADTLVFTGTISGSGGIVQSSPGTLVLTGQNSFTGGTAITGGTLALAGNGRISGPVVNNGVFDIASATGGPVAIAGLAGQGTVSLGNQTLALDGANASFGGTITGAGAVMLTSGSQVLTGTNTHSGGTTISGGTLIATAAALGTGPIVGNGALVIDQGGGDARLPNALSGSGLLVKQGNSKLDLTGDSDFAGTTQIAGGGLAVNGNLRNSVVSAASGTILSGAGTVGGVALAEGAAIAPGNSIGTLTVAGNVVQSAASVYAVEVDPASDRSDRIVAQGSATIAPGAMLTVIKEADLAYAPGRRYTVLTATGGISGRYTVTGDTAISAFYALEAQYAPQSVTLEAMQVRAFTTAAVTRNQVAAAAGLDSLDAGQPLHDIVAMYGDAASATAAFDQLSGEIEASVHSALIEASRFSREAVVDQLRAAACGPGDAAATRCDAGDRIVWGRLFGSSGEIGATAGTAALDISARGVIAGADLGAGEQARVGFYAAGSRSRFSADARGSDGESDNRELGVYAAGDWAGFGLRLGAGYGWHDVDTTRVIAIDGFAARPTRAAKARTLQAFAEAGYRLGTGATAVEPFAGLAHVDLDTDRSTESGGAAALDSAGTSTRATLSMLGLRGSWRQPAPHAAIGLAASVAWRHVYGDRVPIASLAFGSGDAFAVEGAPLARDAVVLEAGAHMLFTPSLTWKVDYSGQLGRDLRDHGLRGTLSWRF